MTPAAPNEIVRTLARAVLAALDPAAPEGELPAARDVAQVLGLDGLDRALSVCRPGDPGTDPIVRRVRALCEIARAVESLEPFMTADSELGRLAVECGAVIEGEQGEAPEGTLSAAEALEDVPWVDDASRTVAERVRLTPQVSAALRAALDWLSEGDTELRRVRLRTEDSALEIGFPHVNPAGIGAAAKVIAAIGGNLGPVATSGRPAASASGAGAWVVRVPIATARATYLMLTQNELHLALPWHSVLRLCMTPRAEFDRGVLSLGLPVLAPLVPLASGATEYPVVLIAHGLKRAYLVADRLVWRLPAEPCESPAEPRARGLLRAVRTEDGTVYRVADAAQLLESVEPLAVADIPRSHAPDPAPPDVAPDASHTPFDAPSFAPALPGGGTALAEAVESESSRVDDLPELDPARVMPLALRVLVAEDSISARHGLAKMFEEFGLEVHAVGTAAELEEALDQGPWALVCVDAELPDARGSSFLSAMRERVGDREPGAGLVVLVRDSVDESTAHDAGIALTLHKPWGRPAVERLLAELGLSPEDA
jgi:CheY-like chemotaxis protein